MSLAPKKVIRWLTLALLVILGFWLRTRDLAKRPMHADEANQAVKLGELIEHGRYAFDPRDHHGPTLYYAAVPVAWIRGQHTLAELDETTVRLVPALFGTASILLLYLLVRRCEAPSAGLPSPRSHERERVDAASSAAPPTVPCSPDTRQRERQRVAPWPALASAAFLALSPPAVYYSRYFIQETLLVTFTLAAFLCVARWGQTRRLRWVALFGVSAGLMQATKASAPLFLAAAGLALLLGRSRERERVENPTTPFPNALSLSAGLPLGLAAFLLTCALFYSAFFTDLEGLRNALAAYGHAFARFGAEAPPTGHEKPWWYYLHLFGWFRTGGLVWHQLAFSALALAGLVVAYFPGSAAAPGRSLHRFSAVYTFLILAAFSIFAYKTPWHAVHFIPGAAVLAAATLSAICRLNTGRLVAAAFALITLGTLYQQTQRVAFLRPSDQRNPYAYVHSAPDVLKYRARAEAAIAAAPGQPIRVITENREWWPLPWYFRGLPQVGYYETPPGDCDGALVIVSATQADAVRARLQHRYTESFLGLRPGVLLVLFTREP